MPDAFEDILLPTQITMGIGGAIEAYAKVEGILALILAHVLKMDTKRAFLIAFAVQNSRARNELYGDLIALEYEGKLNKYWESCSAFLGKLAKFRNALAHWSPQFDVYEAGTTLKFRHRLGQPNLKNTLPTIGAEEIALFLADCSVIQKRLFEFEILMRERPSALPQKFLKPIADQNQALLQPPPKPKEQQLRRPPSTPKLSSAQRLAKALKDAKNAKKS